MITKALLYCTKNNKIKPYKSPFDNEYWLGDDKYLIGLNGYVVAVCDIEVEEIEWLDSSYCANDTGFCTDELSPWDLEHRSCLTSEQLKKYLWKNGKGYAIHIKNLKVFDELKELSEFKIKGFERIKVMGSPYGDLDSVAYHYEKKPMFKPLTKAPQNMCYVDYNGEKYALISTQPQWLVKILNGEKTIEVRKKVLKEMMG